MMKVINSKQSRNPAREGGQLASGEERLIKLSAGAQMFGVSPDAIRKRWPPYDTLTIVVMPRPNAERPTLRLVYSECVALRDKLIHNARQRTDVGRMLKLVVNK